jgi:hypothetical protein
VAYDPPARIDDFARRPRHAEATARGWDAVMNHWLNRVASSDADDGNPSLFFNAHSDTTPGAAATDSAVWDAFPEALTKWFESEPDNDERRWLASDTPRPSRGFYARIVDGGLGAPVQVHHRQQDEYCEWHVVREGERIRKITFTSEGPEYWMYLANGTREHLPEDHPDVDLFVGDLELVAELYREHVDSTIRTEELTWPFEVAEYVGTGAGGQPLWRRRAAGTYNPYNEWNTTRGAMHLTHPSNTLLAEINLAADATVQRRGSDPGDALALICCSGYGDANRSSDPIIGAKVYGFANQGLSVALLNPVGLYVKDWNDDAFVGPEGESLEDAWDDTRGSRESGQVLRAGFEIPGRFHFTVERALANGVPIRWGGQLADAIHMQLTAAAKKLPLDGEIAALGCEARCCQHPDRDGVRAVVGAGADCAQLDWARLAPHLPQVGVAAEAEAPEGERPPRGELTTAPVNPLAVKR